jgi:competence protein ComEC
LWRGENHRLELIDYQAFIGQEVQLQGTIADDLVLKGGSAEIKLEHIQVSQTRLGGQVWVSASTSLNLKRGDRVEFDGKLRPGFGNYAASMSFVKLSSASRVNHGDPSREVRDVFDAGLEKTVPQPGAALAIGYLTGQHNMVPDTFIKQMQVTGLIHLVIAGGYNVTILVRLVRRVCARVAKRLAVMGAATVLLGLMVIAGFIAPMARTTVVTGMSLAAWYYGRWPHPLVLLSVSAAITAFVEPSFVLGDVGWYMTFIAYGGLIVLGPMLKIWWWGNQCHGEIKQIIVDTIAVQIVTTPLMAFAFQQYSVYGLPANLLVLPFMSLTMLAALAAGLAGMTLPAQPAHWMSWPANLLLSYTEKVTVWLAGAPGANYGGGLGIRGLLLSYIVVLIFIWHLKRKTGYDFRTENLVE